MKDTLINSIKKYKWQIMIAILLIWLNMYLLTYPPKIIGEIIDLLYDINQNKEVIFKSILSLLGICILMLFVRTGWKYYVCYANRGMEKELKNPDEEDIKEYLSGNLCRCSGYMSQLRAVKKYLDMKQSGKEA